MKQAEAAVKEIQNNEEAQKWAQQVKGNVGALRDLGMSTSTEQYRFCIMLTKSRRRTSRQSASNLHEPHPHPRTPHLLA
jgi:hypothetical protein